MTRGLLVLSLALVALAQNLPLKREGAYWVQTQSGASPAGATRLKIHTRGPVLVQGSNTNQTSYTLKKRVRARNEAEARRLLSSVVLRTRTGRDGSVLSLHHPNQPLVATEMEVQAPRSLALLDLDTQGGDVQVYDFDGVVEAASGGGYIRMDRIARNAVARTGGGEIRLGRIGGSVRCISEGGSIQVQRAGLESWFETAGGEIYIREAGGPVHATTNGGNIRIEKAAASVSARTAGGRIDVMEAHGLVLAGNSGGSIQIGAAQGVRCESNGGSIRLKGSSGSLRAVTDVGSILAELIPGMTLHDSILTTADGDITVYIPSNLALTIKALNESERSGKIISEFAEVPVRLMRDRDRRGAFAEGTLNGGGPVLNISASGGTIYLRRRP